ncbi:hypothetical protein CC85DRAFT_268159 [Cutaneotrichosporon oleaginosum]|uniref:Checkpoint protein RAD24-like helical bundle domain-containing protein n=1 Tax=Cutaneotrichosporon oleaginosum TaxID=879819 RepID=A0A0J0XYV6_9TREE|nr:uncharacterized protein CC85DRAFT_268159 [Cutaneotrichosporon oleaginosum]KLT46238.1 hypothetical protein CC85DRAFT_268159 [Cutaneotrichosporon oleaginosum]TXT10244.1 hypothetical protein COLE_04178 [Cutaneotrichosporon oleaginosum]
MPPKSAGRSPKRAPKRMGSLSSFQPTLNFPKLAESGPASVRVAPRKEEDARRMPPPSLPKPQAGARNKGKGKAKVEPNDMMDEDIIELIDSDDDEPRKRSLEDEQPRRPEAMWSELYAPTMQSELAPGKARVERVRDWLCQAAHGMSDAAFVRGERPNQMVRDRVRKYRRILLVTGPAGIGKTTTVRLLARSLGVDLVEWTDSVDERGLGGSDVESSLNKLTSYLSRNSYVPLPTDGLLRPSRPRVLLMTSLPNLSYLPTREGFHTAILQFCETYTPTACPLVIVHSDAGAGGRAEESWRERDRGGLETAADLVGREVLNTPWCAEIDFLPLAPTFLKKALNRVLEQAIEDPAQRPSPAAVQLLGLSCNGDLRSAINSLQLLCTGRSLKTLKRRKTGKQENRGRATGKGSRGGRGAKVDVSEEVRAALDSVSRQEQSLNLFHALGKVLYNKRLGDPNWEKEDEEAKLAVEKLSPDDPLPDHLNAFERRTSMIQMEVLTPTIPVDASTFALWIHQNVPSFCTEIEQLSAILDDFCFADLMRTEDDIWQSSPQAISHALHLTVRGTLMGLPSPVPRSNQKVTKPLFFEAFRNERDNGKRLDEAAAHMAKKVIASGTAVADGTLDPEHGLAWGGLLSKRTLACEVIPEAIRIQSAGRRLLLPRSVQELTMPPYGASGLAGVVGDALSERDVTGGEEYGDAITGEDELGVPDGQGWEVWDEEIADGGLAEDEALKEDDIEDWSD